LHAPRESAPTERRERPVPRVDMANASRAVAGPSIASPSRPEAAPPAPPDAPITRFLLLQPARFRYVVTAFTRGATTQGEAQLQWRHDDHEYEAQLEQSGPGLRSHILHSAGMVTAHGLAPVRFSDRSRVEEAVHFERAEGRLSFSNNRADAALEAGAQDRLSVILQLGAMLAAEGSRFPSGASIAIQTASAREAQRWIFVVEGAQQLQLPGGDTTALKLSRAPLGPYDSKLELWLAPAAAYTPVRLRLTQPNGEWLDLQWSSTDRSQ